MTIKNTLLRNRHRVAQLYMLPCLLLFAGCASQRVDNSAIATGSATGAAGTGIPVQLPATATEPLESALLLPVAGHTGATLGIRVEDISIEGSSGAQVITLSIPEEVGDIRDVQVVDASGRRLPQHRAPDILNDYQDNNTGVRIYLAPKSNIQFKLKLSTEQ